MTLRSLGEGLLLLAERRMREGGRDEEVASSKNDQIED